MGSCGTTEAVAALLDKILEGIDKGEYSITIYLDFKKAFDTLENKIVLWKLKRAGMGENTCRLIAKYLS